MMNYEVFKEVIAERIKEFLPAGFINYKVQISIVRKVNQEKDTLTLMPENTAEIAAMPNIYLDEAYEEFQTCQDLNQVLKKIAALIVQYTGRFTAEELDLDLKKKKDSIIMNLINTEKNKELLKTVPHREVMDLSIVYRIIMGEQGDGVATVLVSNNLLEELEMTEEELDQLAYANTGKLFPIEIFKLTDSFYVMTNEAKIHGATAMLYKDATQVLAEKVGGSFYLIPSSIHEVIAVPQEETQPKRLIQMLEEGNRTCTLESEILSNCIYYYDKDTRDITIAASYFTKEEMEEE